MTPSKQQKKRTTFIVDDHPVFRAGLTALINQAPDLSVVGEAEDAGQAIKKIPGLRPDVVLLDISMEGVNGVELAKVLRTKQPDLRLLMISMHPESLYAERSLRAGANGYVMKREGGPGILEAIRRVLEGKTHISREMNEAILQRLSTPGADKGRPSVESLSDRELEVFQLIGDGFGTRQIAEKLNLSMKTVETHREHIREKLGLASTFELVQQAIHWVHHGE